MFLWKKQTANLKKNVFFFQATGLRRKITSVWFAGKVMQMQAVWLNIRTSTTKLISAKFA